MSKSFSTTLVPRRTRVPKIAAYPELLRRVRETFLTAQTKIEQIKLRATWEAGRDIHNHVLHQRDRAKYGDEVISRLSRDLEVGTATIYRAVRLYEVYPIFAALQKLTLTHYQELLKIPDSKKRLEFETEAESRGWTTDELKVQIQKAKSRPPELSGNGKAKSSKLLKPKKGKLGVYQIVTDGGEAVVADEDALAVDLGFTSYSSLAKPGQLKEGNFVGFSPSGRIKKINGASAEDLFTYEAGRWRVVDGDTVWFQIWHKRPLFLWEKLRLRGIDAPEISTAKGRRAKRFLEVLLKKAVKIVITTTKPDKWDRYLSDLFLTVRNDKIPTVGTRATRHEYKRPRYKEIFVNNLLLERGLARRYDDVSFDDWEES